MLIEKQPKCPSFSGEKSMCDTERDLKGCFLSHLTVPLCFQCFAIINNTATNIYTYTFSQVSGRFSEVWLLDQRIGIFLRFLLGIARPLSQRAITGLSCH